MGLGSILVTDKDYAEIAGRPLQAERCALIVVDIQEKLLAPIFEKDRLLHNAQLLARLAGILQIPAVVTTQYARGLGPVVPSLAELLPGCNFIDKTTFGCFGHEPFCSALQALPGKRDTLLICGMESHICVLQTALAALGRDYVVHVVADAVSSRTELNWKLGLERMRGAGAVISSTEMAIYELLQASNTPQFKEMLPYLK
jgi:nicotinamidase-related amidase